MQTSTPPPPPHAQKADSPPSKGNPHVNRMTDTCENITLPHTLFAVGKNKKNHQFLNETPNNYWVQHAYIHTRTAARIRSVCVDPFRSLRGNGVFLNYDLANLSN